MTVANQPPPIRALLARPDYERLREFRYRFSQSVVFGLPVLALEVWGPSLGGPEAERWIGLLQALLAGWAVYAGAAGMLAEGVLVRTRPLLMDTIIALAVVAAYLAGLLSVAHIFLDGQLWYRPLLFHVSVLILCLWTGIQWYRWRRRFYGDGTTH